MKSLIFSLLMLLLVAVAPAGVSANQYGQGTVLGEEEDITKGGQPLPEAGLAENVAVATGAVLAVSGYFIYRSKNSNSVSFK